ncbi:MAG: PsiF family protein [Pseudorhodoplanes sp.]
MVLRIAALGIAALAAAGIVLSSTPGQAITAKEKMVTCKFGADDQGLKGKARTAFLNRCMAKGNAPRGKPVAQ